MYMFTLARVEVPLEQSGSPGQEPKSHRMAQENRATAVADMENLQVVQIMLPWNCVLKDNCASLELADFHYCRRQNERNERTIENIGRSLFSGAICDGSLAPES